MPFVALSSVLEFALLHDLSRFHNERLPSDGLPIHTGKALGWFIRHKPTYVPTLLCYLQREAQEELGVTLERLKATLRDAIRADGGFDSAPQLEHYLKLALPPEKEVVTGRPHQGPNAPQATSESSGLRDRHRTSVRTDRSRTRVREGTPQEALPVVDVLAHYLGGRPCGLIADCVDFASIVGTSYDRVWRCKCWWTATGWKGVLRGR